MATEISVDKKTIEEFLKGAQKEPFLIPEYQRRYSWEKEHVVALFEDLTDFTGRMDSKNNESYFLGVIVYFENNGQREIIDGQQRITSLLLFLRAVYSKLNENIQKNDEEENFIKLIEPLIWKQNELAGKVDKAQIYNSIKNETDKADFIDKWKDFGTKSK